MNLIVFEHQDRHTMLLQDLFDEGNAFIRFGRLQRGPVEVRFLKYRTVCGGIFLMRLRDVESSEKIMTCHSLFLND